MTIFVESAQWLLLGFFIAGLIKAFVPTEFLHKHLGSNSTNAVVKGAILGAPLPLCSCGVIPVALGIRRAGASKAATTSFLIATPETGVDSVFITYALLGPLMAVVRPIAAITTAISAGLAVLWSGESDNDEKPAENTVNTGCCGSKTEPKPTNRCCDSKKNTEISHCSDKKTHKNNAIKPAFVKKIRDGLAFTFIDLIKDTVISLLIGLALAALVMTIIPPEFLAKWGSSPYAYVIMALIGVPMYICAVASTPIAAGLLFAGVSPGAILVFLLVGPATNITTLTIVTKELGNRVLTIYLTVIVVSSFLFGWLTNALSEQFGVGNHLHIHAHMHTHTSMTAIVSAVILAGLLLNGLRKQLPHINAT